MLRGFWSKKSGRDFFRASGTLCRFDSGTPFNCSSERLVTGWRFLYTRWSVIAPMKIRLLLLSLGLSLVGMSPATAQYQPPQGRGCASGFNYSQGMCTPRGGAMTVYTPPQGRGCASGFNYSQGVCVPRSGASNAYQPPSGRGCASGFNYSQGMCVPRR